jgi:hypothetical protein
LFEASRTGAAETPDAALKTIAAQSAIMVLSNMAVSPGLMIRQAPLRWSSGLFRHREGGRPSGQQLFATLEIEGCF